MEKIKLGIIGLGMAWERLHAPALAKLTDKYEIVAVCDTDINKAQSVAAWLGLPPEAAFDHCERMLLIPRIEAVDILVPIYENFELAQTVIKHKKHLIAEKPFAATVEAAKDLIKLKKRLGVKVMVAENFRYDQENVLIKDLIANNRIGNVVYFIDNYVTEFQKDMTNDTFAAAEWRRNPIFKGGSFLDTGVHHIARHRFLFGGVQSVYASGRPSLIDFSPYSCINAMMTFENHIVGHYAFFTIGKETQAPLVGLRIFGTGGEIYLEDKNCGFVNVSYKDGHHEAIPYTPNDGFYQELCNFYDALRNGAEIVSMPEKELGDIEVIFSILDSIETKMAIIPNDHYKPASKGQRSSNPIAV